MYYNPRRLQKEGVMYKILKLICLPMFLLVFFYGSVFAQDFPTNTGSFLLSGSFMFSSAGGDLYEYGNERMMLMQFDPSFNYFVFPGLALGGKFMFEKASQGDYGTTTWGIGPQLLFFIGGTQPKDSFRGTIYPFIGASFIYVRSTYAVGDFSISGTMINLGGGLNFMLSNSVGLIMETNYEIDNMTPEGGESVSGNKFNIGLGFVAFLY